MNNCCCSGGDPKPPCNEQEPCYTGSIGDRCFAPWGAEALYTAIAMLFINNTVTIPLGTINFRLAIPWTQFGFGCFYKVDYPIVPDCCTGPPCGPSAGNPAGCTGECYSTFGITGFEDVQWKAQVYFPNQYLSACTGCCPNCSGSLTWGLPPKTGYPRCCETHECGCVNVTGNGCRFTSQAMNDWYVVVPDTPLLFITPTNPNPFGPIEEPAGHLCCGYVGWTGQCPTGHEFNPLYRRGLLFMDSTVGVTYQAAGSPIGECEHPNAFDVHLSRRLWILPNFSGDQNCIRIVARVTFSKTFYDRIPDIHTNDPGGQFPPPRDCCSDVGLAYVDPCSNTGEHPVHSTGWYYMDIYYDDTVAVFGQRPLRLFRLEHSEYCMSGCGYEQQLVTAQIGDCQGCQANPITGACEPLPDPSCAVDAQGQIVIPATDCPEFPSGTVEVPCVPVPGKYVYPEPPPNSHFDLPTDLWIVIT